MCGTQPVSVSPSPSTPFSSSPTPHDVTEAGLTAPGWQYLTHPPWMKSWKGDKAALRGRITARVPCTCQLLLHRIRASARITCWFQADLPPAWNTRTFLLVFPSSSFLLLSLRPVCAELWHILTSHSAPAAARGSRSEEESGRVSPGNSPRASRTSEAPADPQLRSGGEGVKIRG